MRRVWLVARRDVWAAVGTRRFLLVNLLVPVLVMILPTLLAAPAAVVAARTVSATGHVVIVDEADGLGARVGRLLADDTVHVDEVVVPGPALDELDRLDALVREGRIDGFVRIDAASARQGDWAWHGRRPPPEWLRLRLWDAVRLAVIEAAWASDRDPELLARLRDGGRQRFVGIDPDDAPPDDRAQAGAVVSGFTLFLVLMAVPGRVVARLGKEHQVGLVDLLSGTLTASELLIGKTLAAFVTVGCAFALWLVLPSLGLGAGSLAGGAATAPLTSALAELAPGPDVTVAWWALAVSGALCLTLPAAAVAIQPRRTETEVLAMGGWLLLMASAATMMLGAQAPDDPLVIALSFVPGFGAPTLVARYVVGAPAWHVAVGAGVSLGVGVGLAVLIVRLGRGTRALGGWPRSLAELRAAWAAG